MKNILFILNYYDPYISGVTLYCKLLAENLIKKGYSVTVLTSNHANQPGQENISGVKVIRANVIFKISKGTVSIQLYSLARKLSKQADIVCLHTPMLESGLLSYIINRKKLYMVYQCDVNLPSSLINKLIMKVMDISHKICMKRCRKILVTTIDYASHSRITKAYLNKLVELQAPVKEYSFVPKSEPYVKKRIGFCGRIVEEKGIDVLIKAFEILIRKEANLELIIGGDYENIAGGSIYPILENYIDENKISGISFLGKIEEQDMPSFYSSLDVFVLPSINSLEAFGMVQVEAMMCGTPVVASDLYGVRTIVKKTGMGLIARRGDPKELAHCIQKILDNRGNYVVNKKKVMDLYSTEAVTDTFITTTLESFL